jgi:cytochrome b-561
MRAPHRWLEDRLDLERFRRKYLSKSFPVHHTFFLGEITLISFVTLVATGIFLLLNYEPSGRLVMDQGRHVPAAYASVRYIDTLPFGQVLRSVHHWAAHVMIAAAFLHFLSKFLTGAYKKPRELTWLLGVGLLVLVVIASFTGYALPDDAFAVTATRIGYGILDAVPWVGGWLAKVAMGGDYPTMHSLPRLQALHVFLFPVLIAALIGLHLLLVVKQKHLQPGYAREVAPGRILGVPLAPHQAMLLAILTLLYLGTLFPVGGAFNVHPITTFGPPGPSTPSVKPDWYLLWIYGILQMIPSSWRYSVLGAGIDPEFLGGVLPPALLVILALALPFRDRSPVMLRHMESPRDHSLRTGIAFGLITFFLVASLAGYHEGLGLSITACWILIVAAPVAVVAGTTAGLRFRARGARTGPGRDGG